MNSEIPVFNGELRRVGLEQLRSRWGWYVGLGIALIVLGAIALGSSVLMTMATMVFVGWLMIVGGVIEAAQAFSCSKWGGFFLDLLTGILYAVVGFLIVTNPAESAAGLTLLIAMLLIFSGVFRIVAAIATRFEHWIWMVVHGVISLLLGISIWRQWPYSGLWVIGLFVGIDMLFNGWSLVMLGLTARKIPQQSTT